MNSLLASHKEKGRFLQVNQSKAFVTDQGSGETVLCIHGVPTSSFLYRKITDQLSQNGARAIAFDLLGMGLSDKPKDEDYSWTGLGNWVALLVDALKLEKFHLLIHDIGGPIGCELIAKVPDKIQSVTILNAPIASLSTFKKPFPMFFFEQNVIGELFLSSTTTFLFKKLMHLRGVHKNESFGNAEAAAYLQSLKATDGGKAFLKIMRSFEANAEKEAFYLSTLKNLTVPKQIIWGMNDKGLTAKKYGEPLRAAIGVDEIIESEGSHFLQEDYADLVTDKVLQFLKPA